MHFHNHETFTIRVDVNSATMKRFYQVLRAVDFYGQISWSFHLGLKLPELDWQQFVYREQDMCNILLEHLPALNNRPSRLLINPLLILLARNSPARRKQRFLSRLKQGLSFSARRG